MKVAVIGSRSIRIDNIGDYLPANTSELVSGGAVGIDTCAKQYAEKNKISILEFLPEYEKYKRAAPLKRNLKIIEYADLVLAFWYGKSKGTKFVIENCKKLKKNVKIIIVKNE